MEFIALFILMNIAFIICVKQNNFGLIDIVWGLCFVTIACASVKTLSWYNILILTAVLCWGFRLSIYLAKRNLGHDEDYRYKKMREGWGDSPNLNAYFRVFMLQGCLSFIISLPFWFALKNNYYFTVWNLAFGLAIFAFGLIWESWADKTLQDFKANPDNKGRVCNDGPWKFSRHPNYFGEILLWWGMYIACFNPHELWTIIGPITIHFFILKVSGVPMLEEKLKKNPKYAEYIESTNSLIPKIF